LLDADRRELKLATDLVAVEPQVFDLLVYLVQNRNRVVSKDDLLGAVWGGRIVSESTLTTRINAARRAIGDTGARKEVIRTGVRRAWTRLTVEELDAGTRPGASAGAAALRPRSVLQSRRRFCMLRRHW
jgi:hypothetical protein